MRFKQWEVSADARDESALGTFEEEQRSQSGCNREKGGDVRSGRQQGAGDIGRSYRAYEPL